MLKYRSTDEILNYNISRRSHIGLGWFSCGFNFSILVELEFRLYAFVKGGEPGEKPSERGENQQQTNNKQTNKQQTTNNKQTNKQTNNKQQTNKQQTNKQTNNKQTQPTYDTGPSTVEPRYSEGPKDWQKMFAIAVCYASL